MADDYLYGMREQQVRNLTADVQNLRNQNANLLNANASLQREVERLRKLNKEQRDGFFDLKKEDLNLRRENQRLQASQKDHDNRAEGMWKYYCYVMGHFHGQKAEIKLLLETLDEQCGGADKNPLRQTLVNKEGETVVNPAGPNEGAPLEVRHETYLRAMIDGIRATGGAVESVGDDWRQFIKDSQIHLR